MMVKFSFPIRESVKNSIFNHKIVICALYMSYCQPCSIRYISPDLNLTPLAAFLRFLPSAARLRSAKNVKKQQEVSDLNQD